MIGRWKTIAIQSGTAKIEDAAAAMPAEVQFGEGTIALFHEGKQIGEASYTIDETIAPARMTIETIVPRESLPENRGRIVSFCIDGVCYSTSIKDAPKELFPDPKIRTTVVFRIVDDRLEMTSPAETVEASAPAGSFPPHTPLRIVYERIPPIAPLSLEFESAP